MTQDSASPPTLVLFHTLSSGSDDERYGVLATLDGPTPEVDYAVLRQLVLGALATDYAVTPAERNAPDETDRDPRAMSRRFLAGALARIAKGDPAADALVRKHVQRRWEPNRWVRYEALAGLAASKATDLEEIARRIQRTDKDPWPYMLAVAILASLGDKTQMDEMRRKLRDGPWQVSTLRALRTVPISDLTEEVVELVRSIATGRISDAAAHVLYDGIVALGSIPKTSLQRQAAADALLIALKFCRDHPWHDGHWRQTLRALGNLRLPTVASRLLPDLLKGMPSIVQEAGLALEKSLGPAATVSVLVAASSADSDVDLKSYAKALLYISDQPRVFAELEAIAASGEPATGTTATRLLRALARPGELSISAHPGLLRAFQADHPQYDRNVFVIMSFDPQLVDVWNAIRTTLGSHEHRYTALRADLKTYGDARQLWDNLITYMHGCKYGIAVLEDRSANEFNPNVALEYGFMRALGKQVLLLKDRGFSKIRADILGSVWIGFDMSDAAGSIETAIRQWLIDIQ